MATNRITIKDLESLVQDINVAQGVEVTKYNTMYAYRLEWAYGGVKLIRVLNDGGGSVDVSKDGYSTKRDLYNFLTRFELYKLSHNNEAVYYGSENECYFKLQRSQGNSADWAIKYEGWKVEKL